MSPKSKILGQKGRQFSSTTLKIQIPHSNHRIRISSVILTSLTFDPGVGTVWKRVCSVLRLSIWDWTYIWFISHYLNFEQMEKHYIWTIWIKMQFHAFWIKLSVTAWLKSYELSWFAGVQEMRIYSLHSLLSHPFLAKKSQQRHHIDNKSSG